MSFDGLEEGLLVCVRLGRKRYGRIDCEDEIKKVEAEIELLI